MLRCTFCASVWMNMFFSLLACMSRIRSVELDGDSIFNFLKSSQTVPKSLRHRAPPLAVCEAPRAPHPTLAAVHSVDRGRPGGVKGTGLTLPSDWWHDVTFCVLIDHLYRLVDSSPWPVFKLCRLSFYRWVISVLYVCWYQTLTDTRKEKNFSHSAGFFHSLHSLEMSLETQELKIWMSSTWLRSSLVVLIPWWVAGCFQFGTIMSINIWAFTWISVLIHVW